MKQGCFQTETQNLGRVISFNSFNLAALSKNAARISGDSLQRRIFKSMKNGKHRNAPEH